MLHKIFLDGHYFLYCKIERREQDQSIRFLEIVRRKKKWIKIGYILLLHEIIGKLLIGCPIR